jgi:hypothetical protein
MPRDPYQTLPSLIAISERSLSVEHLAEAKLEFVDASMSAAEAEAFLSGKGYDAAPIAGPPPARFVIHDDLIDQQGSVLDRGRPLDAQHLVSSELSLADGVRLLEALPIYFVLRANSLAGIVTRADLQRQAVSLVLLGFIFASEAAMNILIVADLGDDWMDKLSGEWKSQVDRLYQERVRSNVEISPIDCLMLHQRLSLVGLSQRVCDELGFPSKRSWAKWAGELTRLRDGLAHGGGLLHACPDPLGAIKLFGDVRSFAERIWDLAEAD